MNEFKITFENLNKSFKKNTLFNIPELTVQTNSCSFLSGINGCGKSTLLKIIAGLEKPDNSILHFNNKAISWKSACKEIHRDIIYLHQAPLMFDTSVTNNIKYGLRKQGYSRISIQQKLIDALKWANIEHLKNDNARLLSGGEKQRVALARAYVLSPKILLLDEAFSNLDTAGREQIYNQICKLKENGVGIILTTHETSQIKGLANKNWLLENKTLTLKTYQSENNNIIRSREDRILKVVNI
jgi:tungstate transport system ATP-binding protein